MSNILALDFGEHLGWATSYGNDKIASGVSYMGHEKNNVAAIRYLNFKVWLYAWGGEPLIDHIVYELPLNINKRTKELCINFAGIVQTYLHNVNGKYEEIPPKSMKKWLCGTGNASKEDVMKEVSQRIKRQISNEHEADAIALLLYTMKGE
jgi:hypothetical protein